MTATDSTANVLDKLRSAGDYAARLDVDLLLEPQNRQEFPFIYSTEDGIAFVEQVARPNVGLMLDTFHMNMEGEDAPASIERAMPYLRHIHFLDMERNPPTPADTQIDVMGILRTLARRNYQHYLSMPLVRNAGLGATEDVVAQLRAAVPA